MWISKTLAGRYGTWLGTWRLVLRVSYEVRYREMEELYGAMYDLVKWQVIEDIAMVLRWDPFERYWDHGSILVLAVK